MSTKIVGRQSPTKKSSTEHAGRAKEVNLQNKALSTIAQVEHEFGKYLYEFFFACFNLILYHRGLHSKRLFTFKENSFFEMKIPYMRFPETIVYLEKVTQKGVNCLMANYLQAFLFEERDRYGNSVVFLFRLHGFPVITPTTLLFQEEITAELKSNCESLLRDLTRTLTSMTPITQPTLFRWRIELGLKKVDDKLSKWRNNNQGIFINDPDWKLFPWTRNGHSNKKRRRSDQKVNSPVNTEDIGDVSSPERNKPQSSEYFAGSNFQDVTLEEDMGDAPAVVQEDYEKEGLTIIEYVEETAEKRPGSPDMFADSPKLLPSHTRTFHMDANTMAQIEPVSTEVDGSTVKTVPATATMFTLVDPRIEPDLSCVPLPEHDSSAEDFEGATDIFDDFDDFNYLDKAVELLDSSDVCMDELDTSLNMPNLKATGNAKLYPIATSKLLDRLLCNILAVRDTSTDEMSSDYRPPPSKNKKRHD